MQAARSLKLNHTHCPTRQSSPGHCKRVARFTKTTSEAVGVAENREEVSFARPHLITRGLAVTGALLGLLFVVVVDEWPAVRLALAAYVVWALGEWLFHRYNHVDQLG